MMARPLGSTLVSTSTRRPAGRLLSHGVKKKPDLPLSKRPRTIRFARAGAFLKGLLRRDLPRLAALHGPSLRDHPAPGLTGGEQHDEVLPVPSLPVGKGGELDVSSSLYVLHPSLSRVDRSPPVRLESGRRQPTILPSIRLRSHNNASCQMLPSLGIIPC